MNAIERLTEWFRLYRADWGECGEVVRQVEMPATEDDFDEAFYRS
jgi:hypothetical protein